MNPILNNCLVRGCENDYFLQHYLLGDEFKLEKLHAEILWHCNGEKNIKELSNMFSQPKEDIEYFLNILKKENLIIFSNSSKRKRYPVLTKAPYLQEIQIEGTGQCNLWCKHCYGREKFAEATNNELTYHEICNVIDQIAEANIGKCFLSGGEIFTRKELPEIIEYLAKRHIYINGIFTNATIYRPEVFEALKQTGMKTTLLISLDGDNSETHDFIRGKNTFNKTILFIKRVIESGFHVTVNTVVMKQNVKSLLNMRQFLKNLGISRWRISVPREQGEAIINKELIEPKWDDIFTAYKTLLLHTLNNPNGMKIQLSSIFKTEFLETGKYFLYQKSSRCCEYKKGSLVLAANGNLIPCPAGMDIVFGNVREENILDIWHKDKTQAFKNLPISAINECSDCEIWEYCGTGCRIIAKQIHNDFLAKDDNACSLYNFFFNTVKPILEDHGIKSQKLQEAPKYRFEPNLINQFF